MKNLKELPTEHPLDSCEGIALVTRDFRSFLAGECGQLLKRVHPSCLARSKEILDAMEQDFRLKRLGVVDFHELRRLGVVPGIDVADEQASRERVLHPEDSFVETFLDCDVCVFVDIELNATELRRLLRAAGYRLDEKRSDVYDVPSTYVLCTRMRKRIRIAFVIPSLLELVHNHEAERVAYSRLRDTFGVYFSRRPFSGSGVLGSLSELTVVSGLGFFGQSTESTLSNGAKVDAWQAPATTLNQISVFCALRGQIPFGVDSIPLYSETAQRHIEFLSSRQDQRILNPIDLRSENVFLYSSDYCRRFLFGSLVGRVSFVAAYLESSDLDFVNESTRYSLKRLKSFLETEFFLDSETAF